MYPLAMPTGDASAPSVSISNRVYLPATPAQGTRWQDGRLLVWSANRNRGRGEGSSGLHFDSLAT